MISNLNYLIKYLFSKNSSLVIFFIKIVIFSIFELIGLTLILSLVNQYVLEVSSNLNLISQIFAFFDIQEGLTQSALLISSFYVMKLCFSIFFIKSQQMIIAKGHAVYSKNIFSNYLNSVYYRSSRISTEDIIRNITNLSEKVFNEYFISIFNSISEFFILFVVIMFFFIYNPLATFYLLLVFTTLSLLVIYFFLKDSSDAGLSLVNSLSKLSKAVAVVVGLGKEVRSLKLENKFIYDFHKNMNEFVNAKKIDNYNSRIPIFFIEFIAIIILLIILVLLNFLLDKNISLVAEFVAVFSIGIIRFIPSANRIVSTYHAIKFYKPLVIDLDFDNYYLKNSEKIPHLKKNLQKFSKNISIKNLNILIENKQVVSNFSLEINRGDKILIKGESGSGKSSLFNFLSGLIPLTSGVVKCENKIVDRYLRFINPISIVTQENFVIPDRTIFFNVTLTTIKNDRNVLKFKNILKNVGLYELVNNLKDKENTSLSAGGILNFSGGEKQRLCIGRALYNDFDILLMDEPFSGLDEDNRSLIMKNIFSKYKNKTIILTSHVNLNKKYFNKIKTIVSK